MITKTAGIWKAAPLLRHAHATTAVQVSDTTMLKHALQLVSTLNITAVKFSLSALLCNRYRSYFLKKLLFKF
jgi:hypothetical protein